MKTWPKAKPRRRHPKGVPAFLPVPLRLRADGWTPRRQAGFLVALARTRSVLGAARKVGMSRESAYRLRKAPGGESFAAAWDHALGRAAGKRKFTVEEHFARAFGGMVKPVVWQGELCALTQKTSDSALLGQLRQFDRHLLAEEREFGKSHTFTPRSVSTAPVPTAPPGGPIKHPEGAPHARR